MYRLLRALALTYLLMLTLLIVAAYPFSNPDFEPIVQEINGVPMVYVPEGCFPMGSGRWEVGYVCRRYVPGNPECRQWFRDEMPQHEVCLSAFWIGLTEVTNAQYAACVNAGACESPDCRYIDDPAYADHPVVCVDWYRATTYAEWLSDVTGQAFGLPTEAQWDYAARGPMGNAYPWGNNEPAWLFGNSRGSPHMWYPIK
jgi:formylglycine-generating enzyme required for sulfatase activity